MGTIGTQDIHWQFMTLISATSLGWPAPNPEEAESEFTGPVDPQASPTLTLTVWNLSALSAAVGVSVLVVSLTLSTVSVLVAQYILSFGVGSRLSFKFTMYVR